jgi:hypothetical protein
MNCYVCGAPVTTDDLAHCPGCIKWMCRKCFPQGQPVCDKCMAKEDAKAVEKKKR